MEVYEEDKRNVPLSSVKDLTVQNGEVLKNAKKLRIQRLFGNCYYLRYLHNEVLMGCKPHGPIIFSCLFTHRAARRF